MEFGHSKDGLSVINVQCGRTRFAPTRSLFTFHPIRLCGAKIGRDILSLPIFVWRYKLSNPVIVDKTAVKKDLSVVCGKIFKLEGDLCDP